MVAQTAAPQEYWGTSKYSYPDLSAPDSDGTLTFQALAQLDGEPYARPYQLMRERIRDRRSAAQLVSEQALESWVSNFEEIGLMDKSQGSLRVTPAGRQLLDAVRSARRTAARIAAQVLARYQLDNPAPKGVKMGSAGYHGNDVFPFWVIWKVMTESDDRVSNEEMKRIVLKLIRMADLSGVLVDIGRLRQMRASGASDATVEAQIGSIVDYPEPDQLVQYWMRKAAAGGLLMDREATVDGYYHLRPETRDIVEEVVRDRPVLGQFDDAGEWMSHYGAPVLWGSARGEEMVADEDPVWAEIEECIEAGDRVIVLSGPPGTSKTWYARRIALRIAGGDPQRFEFVQFHPSYCYEDFVEGYVPISSEGRAPSFEVRPKVLLEMCERAARDPESLYVLVVDELTRADVSRVFGEFLTYLEYRGRPVRLPYSDHHIAIPDNLVVIATVNPLDRSTGPLDAALIRRFSHIEMEPSERLLDDILREADMSSQLRGQVKGVFNQIRRQLHFQLGHCFFLGAADEADLARIWRNKLRPLFQTHWMHEEEKFRQAEELYPWKDTPQEETS